MVILASQFELAVGNPLDEVHHVPCNQSGGILDNLRSNADMTLRDGLDCLFMLLANILVGPFELDEGCKTEIIGHTEQWRERNLLYPHIESSSALSPSRSVGASGR